MPALTPEFPRKLGVFVFLLRRFTFTSATLGATNALQTSFRRQRPRLTRPTTRRCGRVREAASHLSVMTDEDSQIMTGQQVAELLQVSPRTLEEWRQTRTGPPYRRMGRHVRYLRREVLTWFEGLDPHA